MQKRNMLQKWNGCFWAYYLDLADSFFILAQQAGYDGQQFSFLYGLGEVLIHAGGQALADIIAEGIGAHGQDGGWL